VPQLRGQVVYALECSSGHPPLELDTEKGARQQLAMRASIGARQLLH